MNTEGKFSTRNSAVFCITYNIKDKFGGMTGSLLKRNKIFEELGHIPSTIVTLRDNFDLRWNVKALRGKKIGHDTTVLNMYEFYSEEEFSSEVEEINNFLEEEEVQIEDHSSKGYKVFKNGMYTKFISFKTYGDKVGFVEYFNEEEKKFKREEYDKSGYLRKTILYNVGLNLPKEVFQHRKDKTIFLKTIFNYDEKKGKNVTETIEHLKRDKSIINYKNLIELEHVFLDAITSNKEHNFLIVDSKIKMKMIMAYKCPKNEVYKIYFMHSAHSVHLHDKKLGIMEAPIRKKVQCIFKELYNHDAVVILTKEQKSDLIKRFGDISNLNVIPHSYSGNKIHCDVDQKNLKRIIAVGRLDKVKQHTHMIKAMKKVSGKIKDATLDIYGDGGEEEKISKLIKELKVEDNVFLRGFSDNINKEFEKSALSILSSEYEGQPLVILESLACGCPVVSYNTKYGPSDMIRDGVNGRLVPYGDIDKLADTIIEVLSNPEEIKIFIKNSEEILKEYTEEIFLDRWINLFNKLIESRKQEKIFKGLKVQLKDTNLKEENFKESLFDILFRKSKSKEKCYIKVNLNKESKDIEGLLLNNLTLTFEERDTKYHINLPFKSLKEKEEFIELKFEFSMEEILNKIPLKHRILDLSIGYSTGSKDILKRISLKSLKEDFKDINIKSNKKTIKFYKTVKGNLSIEID